MSSVTVMIAEHQRLVLEAVANTLNAMEGIEVIAAVSEAAAVIPVALRCRPTVAVLDLDFWDVEEMALPTRLRQELPSSQLVLMSAIPQQRHLRAATDLPALAMVSKRTGIRQLAATVQAVASGLSVLGDNTLTGLQRESSPLNTREAEALRFSGEGHSIREIAKAMCLADGSVRNLISMAISKVEARNRFDAAKIALHRGWL